MTDMCIASTHGQADSSSAAYAETMPAFSIKSGRRARNACELCSSKVQAPEDVDIEDGADTLFVMPSLGAASCGKESVDFPTMAIADSVSADTYRQCNQGTSVISSEVVTSPKKNDTPPARPSSEIEIGSIIDSRYEILSEISRGGYGIVYRARQIGVDRVVALKRLRSQSDFSVVQRFLLETSIIKNLIHPNTIQLIDAGIEQNHLYIVMEYIEGRSLYAMMRCGQALEVSRAVNITRQILKSVNEAHQRGVIHRDLKPSNILVRNVIGERDFVKVLDFGIAKVQSAGGTNMQLTREGSVLGTPQYFSPEAVQGKKITAQSDLFAIGLMFYEMVSGRRALPSRLRNVVDVLLDPEPIAMPNEIRGTILEPFLARALEKDCSRRYLSAEMMLADLDAIENTLKNEPKFEENSNNSSENKMILFSQIVSAIFIIVVLAAVIGISTGYVEIKVPF